MVIEVRKYIQYSPNNHYHNLIVLVPVHAGSRDTGEQARAKKENLPHLLSVDYMFLL
jgi:hypothetical protein